jgi:hypothetical protein
VERQAERQEGQAGGGVGGEAGGEAGREARGEEGDQAGTHIGAAWIGAQLKQVHDQGFCTEQLTPSVPLGRHESAVADLARWMRLSSTCSRRC